MCHHYGIFLTKLQIAVVSMWHQEKGKKRQLGLLKRILKQFKRSCICIYSPCDSDVWQLQSDQYMACFRSIKTKRHVCLGAFCFFTWQPSGGASYWCGTREAALFLNLKIKFFRLKVGRWVEVVSTSLSGFRNETGVFINLQNTAAETHERLISCITGYTEKKFTNIHVFFFFLKYYHSKIRSVFPIKFSKYV